MAETTVRLPDLDELVEWFDSYEEKTRDNQVAARRDRDYYDGIQWTKAELRDLEERRQPALVKNRIARKINFILGEEIKKRVNPAARPRTPQHEDSARAATDALRYVADEQDFDAVRSAVLRNVIVEGFGGALKELEQDGDEYKHKLRHIEWDRLFYDPHSRAIDFSDARYMGIVQWLDIDDAIELAPDKESELRAAVDCGGDASETFDDSPRAKSWNDRRRQRVKVAEIFFRIGRDWYRAVYTKGALIEEPERTVYLDEKGKRSVCPLKMISCYVDANGNRYGVVRGLVSPQDEINKRSSKALHLLTVRQVVSEDGMVKDPQRFTEELAKPDGFATGVTPGALKDGSVVIRDGLELAQGQVMMLTQAQQDIDTIGPSSSTLPDLPDSASGRAFIARQQAASQELGGVFDNLRRWTRQVFELDWQCIRQFWTEAKWLRVTDDQELTGYRFVALNQQTTRAQRFAELLQKGSPPNVALESAAGEWAPTISASAQQMAQMAQQQGADPQQATLLAVTQHPLMQESITVNQVDQMLVDIVLDEAPDTAVLAQEEFATLSEIGPTIVQARPDLAPVITRMLVKASQLPNKRELVQELDKGPDPQQQQQQQQQMAMQQQVQALQQALAEANVAVSQTKAQLQAAQAAKTQMETQLLPQQAQAEIAASQAQAVQRVSQAGAARQDVPYGFDQP